MSGGTGYGTPEQKAFGFDWPGLSIVNAAGEAPSAVRFGFSFFDTPGTIVLFCGILTMIALRVGIGRALKTYGETLNQLKWAILTVMAVLGLAYVMNLSGMTTSLGRFAAQSGSFFAFLSSIIGWLGVAITGSDTSSNALFGVLQVTAAKDAGLSATLLAAANSSGGVLGKMVSPQNLAIGAAAVGMAGREGDILRKCLGWSLALTLLMCIIVVLQAGPLSFMVTGP
jgi:lactate permease